MINISFVLLGVGMVMMPLGRGFAFGALTVAVWTFGEMLTFIVAPVVGTAIYDGLGPDAVWYVCAATCLVITVAFSALRLYLNGVGPQQV